MIEGLTKKFYIYTLSDDADGVPFYVGKGTGRRIYCHGTEAENGHKCPKCSKIRKIWREGRAVKVSFVYQTDVEWRAFKKEKELIAELGSENLTNLTGGGEGRTRHISLGDMVQREIELEEIKRRVRGYNFRKRLEKEGKLKPLVAKPPTDPSKRLTQ
jgi:hypothetical protein